MMIKYKPYEEYKDSGVEWLGKIPNHWKLSKINFDYSFTTGFTPPSGNEKYYSYDGYKWLNISDFSTKLIKTTKNRISKHAIMEYGPKISKKNSLVFTFKLSIGKVGILSEDMYTNEAIATFDVLNGNTMKYLYYASPIMITKNAKENIYGAKILNQELIKDAKILIPTKYEQLKIADFLDKITKEIDNIILKKEKLIEKLEEYKKSVITEAVTKGKLGNKYLDEKGQLVDEIEMKDSGIEWIGDIPKYWKINRLKNVSNVLLSNVNKKSIPNEPQVLLCNYTDVYYNDFIDLEINFMKATTSYDKKSKLSLKIGDVIITKDSESPDDIGVPSCVKDTTDNLVCGYHLAMLKPKREIILGEFLFRLLDSEDINFQFNIKATGITRYAIGLFTIKNLLVFHPDIKNQNRIIKYLNQITSSIKELKEKTNNSIQKYKEYKKSLIFEAVTGKIDLRDYEVERSEENVR